MDNILTTNEYILDDFNPIKLAVLISGNLKSRRLNLNITQEELAQKSGVSLGSIKRFENKAEISLKNLLLLAVALDGTHEFKQLFAQQSYETINQVIDEPIRKKRKRARKK